MPKDERGSRMSATKPQAFAWLIESNRIAGVPMYATCDDTDKWTINPQEAARFPTRTAANNARTMLLLYNTDEGGSEDAKPVEHGFCYAPSESTQFQAVGFVTHDGSVKWEPNKAPGDLIPGQLVYVSHSER